MINLIAEGRIKGGTEVDLAKVPLVAVRAGARKLHYPKAPRF